MKIALLPLVTSPDGTENAVVVAGDGAAKRTNLLDWATAQLATAKDAALSAIASAQTTATTAINALVTSAQGYANAAVTAASVTVAVTQQDTAATGRPIGTNPVAGTGPAGAGVYIISDTATLPRVYYQVRSFNNSGSSKVVNLYRGVLTGGNWVRTGTAVAVTIPSGTGFQTVSLPSSLTVNVGERLYADQPVAGAFNYTNLTTGDNGGYLLAATGSTSVADGAGTTNVRLEFAADYTFPYITTTRTKGIESSVAAATAGLGDAAAAYAGIKADGAFWRPKGSTLVAGTSLATNFGFVTASVVPRRRVARAVSGYKSSTSAGTITLYRANVALPSRGVTANDASTAVVAVPAGAGPFSVSIPNGFVFQSGDEIGVLATAGSIDFVSATGDEGGYYGLSGAVTTGFTANALSASNNVQLQLSIAFDEIGDIQAPVVHVNMQTADRGYLFGDSYGAGQFNLKNHAAISRISRQTPWQILNFSLGGSTIRRDDGIAQSRLSAFRSNVARFGTVGPQAIPFKIGFVALGRNDATLGNTPQQTIEDYAELDQIVAGGGGLPVVLGSGSDHYGNDQLPMYKRMAESRRRDFADVGQYARRLGQNKSGNTGSQYSDNHWKAGHPGMRIQFLDQAVLDYLEGIGNPLIGMKVFRPRNTAASLASLYYGESDKNYTRNLLWQEIVTGHSALSAGAEKYWDELINGGVAYGDVACEYTTLLANGTIPCFDFALVEFTVDRLQQHSSNMVFKMLDAGCTIQLPDMTAASPANGTAPGSVPPGLFGSAISPTVSNGIASYAISDAVKKKTQRFDKIIVAIVKTGGGAFNLGGLDLSYWAPGPVKPSTARGPRVVPRGAEQMASISFPTSGAPAAPWAVVSGSPTCSALDPNDTPIGATGICTLAPGDSISQPIPWTAPTYGDKEFEVWVYARLKVAAFSSASTYPDASPVTDATLAQTQVALSLYQASASNKAVEPKTIGMGWTLVPLKGLAQIGTTGQTVVIAPTTDTIEVCLVRSAFIDG